MAFRYESVRQNRHFLYRKVILFASNIRHDTNGCRERKLYCTHIVEIVVY